MDGDQGFSQSLLSTSADGGQVLRRLVLPIYPPTCGGAGRNATTSGAMPVSLPISREESMVTRVDVDIQQIWYDYRAHPTVALRNQLVEHYLPLVKYNAARIW